MTCLRSLRGGWSRVRICNPLDARHRTYHCATMPHKSTINSESQYIEGHYYLLNSPEWRWQGLSHDDTQAIHLSLKTHYLQHMSTNKKELFLKYQVLG